LNGDYNADAATTNEGTFGGKLKNGIFKLSYEFIKPVLMKGYMIKTADDFKLCDPKNWTIEDENGNVVHAINDEEERGRNEEKQYILEGKGVWCKKIELLISGVQPTKCKDGHLMNFIYTNPNMETSGT